MNKLSGALRDQLRDLALEQIYWPRKARTIVEGQHLSLYKLASEIIGISERILFLEFGVAQGKSISQISALFGNPESAFVGFDSFIGLPEEWLMHHRGAFSNGGRPPAIEDQRVRFVTGWFQNTVPEFFKDYATRDAKILVHFDADLYSSTLFILFALWNVFDKFYFMFDDFIHDDCVALYDFTTACPTKFEFIAQTRGGGPGPNPDQVFGTLERVPFQISPDNGGRR